MSSHGAQKIQETDMEEQELLKNALANSINTISARLMDRVGPRPVIDLAKKNGN